LLYLFFCCCICLFCFCFSFFFWYPDHPIARVTLQIYVQLYSVFNLSMVCSVIILSLIFENFSFIITVNNYSIRLQIGQ
jgi:hypothetical protein